MRWTCPNCGSDALVRDGALVTDDDDWREIGEIGACLACGATLRYEGGLLRVLSLKETQDMALRTIESIRRKWSPSQDHL